MSRLDEFEDCTFSPKTNPVNQKNLGLMTHLKQPAHERLNQIKKLPEEAYIYSQEQRELKGATFHPNISSS